MEASRDDFVIAVRSAFLKKSNKQRFSLVSLIIICLIFLTLGKFQFSLIDYLRITLKEVVYRSSFIVSVPENYAKNLFFETRQHFDLYNNLKSLEVENKVLKSENLNNIYLKNENDRLRKIVDDYFISSEAIIGKVLIDKSSPFLRSVVVNKGSKDNIKLGMAVLDGEYLIGKIVEVNYLTSRVLLLSDLNSKIPVTVEPGGFQSILSGTGKEYGNLQYSQGEYFFADDSTVFSSGSGGIFKPGIPIGILVKSKNENDFQLSFFSDFSQLKFVEIKSFKIEEKKDD